MSQVFLSVYLPAQPVTSVQNTNVETVITSTEEELIETTANYEAPETEVSDLPQYESGNTYDPSGNPELDEIRLRLNSKPLNENWVSSIRGAANKKHFPLELQFEVADMSKAVTFTLGELAATAIHEKAVQYIYPKRVEHVLFGPHGIAKGNKLSNDIQVCWLRGLDGELDPTPCITSGRHRLSAIILLLQHLGITWEKQRIMVSTKVVSTDAEFAQLIFDNNDSRKMNQAEKRNHKLGALGINTASEDAFYSDPVNSVRRARTNVAPQAFAAACRFRADDKPQAYQDRLYQYAAGAYTKVRDASKENRDSLRDLIQMPQGTEEEVLRLKNAAQFVSDNLLTAIAKGRELFPLAYECHAAPKGLALLLAAHLGVTAPDFTEAE
jgi:hypothetical protein